MAIAQQTAETVAAKAASVAQYGGGSVAFLGGMTANEIAAVGGLVIGLIGYFTNLWFKAQHLKIARERAQADPEE